MQSSVAELRGAHGSEKARLLLEHERLQALSEALQRERASLAAEGASERRALDEVCISIYVYIYLFMYGCFSNTNDSRHSLKRCKGSEPPLRPRERANDAHSTRFVYLYLYISISISISIWLLLEHERLQALSEALQRERASLAAEGASERRALDEVCRSISIYIYIYIYLCMAPSRTRTAPGTFRGAAAGASFASR